MRKTLFIILSSFLLNSCCINQMNIFGLCTEPIEVPNAPLKEILSAKNEGIIIDYHEAFKTRSVIIPYDHELFCGCYKFGGINYTPNGYKDKYWYVYKTSSQNQITNYKFIIVTSIIINGRNANRDPDVISRIPDFLVVERTGSEGSKEFIRVDYEIETKPF